MTENTKRDWTTATALLFDLDGVLTPTALVHELAWQQLFDGYLAQTGHRGYSGNDYFDFIDGKPRFDGVRDFLASRGITLPEGPLDDDPAHDTVHGLGNRKNLVFNSIIASDGVAPYPGSVRFVEAALARGLKLAVVSSSRNAPAVLKAAGLDGDFPVVVDGQVAARHGLPGKPDHATFTYAAELLGVPTRDCIVVEDAVSGVQAGSSGDFRAVIGVDRGAGHQTLLDAGATFVVDDLSELLPTP
ncbi:beta-phosphoglucomutase family hydrolase [Arthrobacter silviterrae]|uniref:HAD-IA family hydrolase n=1 Tax=Arthrobacter silviterrae TaxID=2026658 RepID=A0ABX0DCM1_9MICC|nr:MULTISPECIES: HAD-IA family hydrolase [Arthrobacter]MCU6481215.1 HAD-IA family hydrolase [Arthrobacter sp. A2-55]MDQ0278151.1 beta-phosphoglucomutase family hydrolase [Arthrobacter silviterrae]NGN84383.1 HAD-IA family hydrolase [Arthrobacter silviterrae]